MRNKKDFVLRALAKIKRKNIKFTDHSLLRAYSRGIDPEEVIGNLINPKRLVQVEEQESKFKNERKFTCYFRYSKNQYHKYVIAINLKKRKIIIIMVVKRDRRIQKEIDKHVKL